MSSYPRTKYNFDKRIKTLEEQTTGKPEHVYMELKGITGISNSSTITFLKIGKIAYAKINITFTASHADWTKIGTIPDGYFTHSKCVESLYASTNLQNKADIRLDANRIEVCNTALITAQTNIPYFIA